MAKPKSPPRASASPIEPPPTHIVVRIPIAEARHLSLGCADILCWSAGFKAGRGDDTENNPIGLREIRTLRTYLDQAIDPDKPFRDMPF